MNNKYYGSIPNNPIFTGNDNNSQTNNYANIETNQLMFQQILEYNKGKKVTIYQSYNNNQTKFPGIIEQKGQDYIILSNPTNGKWYLLPIMYIDYIEFDEKINLN